MLVTWPLQWITGQSAENILEHRTTPSNKISWFIKITCQRNGYSYVDMHKQKCAYQRSISIHMNFDWVRSLQFREINRVWVMRTYVWELHLLVRLLRKVGFYFRNVLWIFTRNHLTRSIYTLRELTFILLSFTLLVKYQKLEILQSSKYLFSIISNSSELISKSVINFI